MKGGSCREGGKPAVNKRLENPKPCCYRENSQSTKCFIFLVLAVARSCLSSPKQLCHSPVEALKFPFPLWNAVATLSPSKNGNYQLLGELPELEKHNDGKAVVQNHTAPSAPEGIWTSFLPGTKPNLCPVDKGCCSSPSSNSEHNCTAEQI